MAPAGLAVGLLVSVAGLLGPGRRPGPVYPPPDRAQAALEAALTAWQQGAPRRAGRRGRPTRPSSSSTASGRGPEAPGRSRSSAWPPATGPRVFTVKLTLDGPASRCGPGTWCSGWTRCG